MLLKNTKARLITINGKFENGSRSAAYQIKPGKNPSVEVPNELCDCAFVQALIEDGSLVVESEDDVTLVDVVDDDTDADSYADMSKTDIVALCEARDIEVNSRDTKAELVSKLQDADAE